MEKTTPLYATHQAHGGKLVPLPDIFFLSSTRLV